MSAVLRGLKTPGRAMPRGSEALGVGSTKARLELGEVLGGQCQSRVGSWQHLGA